MRSLASVLGSTVVVMLAGIAACVPDGAEPGGDEANATAACPVVSAKDGHTLSAAELEKLGDPVAKLVLQGAGCPTTFAQVQDKLTTTDPCREGEPGVATRFVSERSVLLNQADSYRLVTSRQCQGRQVHELLMSVSARAGAGGSIATATVSDFIEVIGERRDATNPDKVSGVFNFYARENGKWTFFGGSDELVSQGYECNADGACIPKAAAKQRCAGCHVGGGLLMKELSSPWMFWGGSRSVPIVGMQPLAAKFPKLFGTRLNGAEMEQAVVRAGNADWARARVDVLQKVSLQETLRPLFCTLDMNLEVPSFHGVEVGVTFPRALNGNVFLDSIWDADRMPADGPALAKAEQAIGQRVLDSVTRKPFERNGEIIRGSSLPALGALSIQHRELLVSMGIVDTDFVKDVLAVDMTRPIYSKARCSLLEHVPALPAADMKPAKIKRALADALAGKPGLAPELRDSLLNDQDGPAHDAAARAFLEACKARQAKDPAGFSTDVVRYTSHLRNAARRSGEIIETSEMLAVDDLPDSTKAFDRTTCTLID